MHEEFLLEVPSEAQFVRVARLALAGIANNANMAEEDVEDLKVCISEACNSIIQNPESRPEDRIDIRCSLTDDGLVVKVTAPNEALSKKNWDYKRPMGKMFIETLMDDIRYEQGWNGKTAIEMIKYFPLPEMEYMN